ncbi:hypothetical protein B0H17DRAFT_1207877 [Mycena rosella]|uniref:F-box domain-containing protein n=1 Tax=Mycena rosella TaxID=1033263 RepID=A0AAD7D1V8_MYCRO|nr:hypothetical protein B0H17DRAFT_1207877 [Mycena rosella]
MRRAYKAISQWLPNEVLTEIIQAATQEDQASLCRVSKLFHALSLPVLNRTVRLAHYASASAFSSAIIENPTRGQAFDLSLGLTSSTGRLLPETL